MIGTRASANAVSFSFALLCFLLAICALKAEMHSGWRWHTFGIVFLHCRIVPASRHWGIIIVPFVNCNKMYKIVFVIGTVANMMSKSTLPLKKKIQNYFLDQTVISGLILNKFLSHLASELIYVVLLRWQFGVRLKLFLWIWSNSQLCDDKVRAFWKRNFQELRFSE